MSKDYFFTFKKLIYAKELADSNFFIEGWFGIYDDKYSEDSIDTVFVPLFDFKTEYELCVKSEFIVNMLNGALVLLGHNNSLQLDLLLNRNSRVREMNAAKIDYYLKNKIIDIEYDHDCFKLLKKKSNLLALIYLSNFDHYCRYSLFILSKFGCDYVSLYKLYESMYDRIDYFIKLFRPSTIKVKTYKSHIEKIISSNRSIFSDIDTFNKVANKYSYTGVYSRHGINFRSNVGALSSAESKLSEEEIFENGKKAILIMVYSSLLKLYLWSKDNNAQILSYNEVDFIQMTRNKGNFANELF